MFPPASKRRRESDSAHRGFSSRAVRDCDWPPSPLLRGCRRVTTPSGGAGEICLPRRRAFKPACTGAANPAFRGLSPVTRAYPEEVVEAALCFINLIYLN
jgi:hypothetical protein